jgi:DNA-binding transcriptional LysR family regulator
MVPISMAEYYSFLMGINSAASASRPPPALDRLASLTVFVRVVETGNFSRAARELGIAQPTASKHVASLEARYGLRLLARTTRRVRPTDEGRAFYVQAKALLAEYEDLESTARRSARAPGGNLRVSCPPALGRMVIAPLVFRYLQLHPGASVDLDLSARYLDPIEEGADVAIRIGELPDSTHRARLLGPSARTLVASPNYLARAGEPTEPADLARHEVLVYSYLPAPDMLKLHHPKRGAVRIRVSGRLRVNNSEVLASAVVEGLGVACLPDWSVREPLAQGRLRGLLPEWEPEGASIHAVFPGGRNLPERVRRFLDFLARSLRTVG